jgi:hypothetical protein
LLSKYASKRLLEECIVGAEVACAEQLCKLTCLGSIEGDGRLRPPLAREKTTVEDEGERLLALLATCEEVLRGSNCAAMRTGYRSKLLVAKGLLIGLAEQIG